MNLIHKYVFRRSISACLVCVGIFVAVLIMGNAIRDVINLVASGKMSLWSAAKVMCVLTPSIISYALPLGILTGILVTIGKLSSNNEILAMKASGVSIYNISAPIFLIAICASVLSIFINFYYSPIAYNMYRSTFKTIAKTDPIKLISAGVFVDDFPGYVIYSDYAKNGELRDFKIWQLAQDDSIDMFVKADRGVFGYDDSSDALLLRLKHGNGEKAVKNKTNDDAKINASSMFFDEMTISLPMDKFISSNSINSKKIKHMTLGELMALRHIHNEEIEKNHDNLNAKSDKMVVQTQIQKNFVMSFSIFSMAILAVPLGLQIRRSERSTNIIIALALSFTYYFSVIVLSWFDRAYFLRPDILIWLPNILLQILGFSLLRKVAKF